MTIVTSGNTALRPSFANTPNRGVTAALLLTAVVTLLTGCGTAPTTPTPAPVPMTTPSWTYNGTDVSFAAQLVPHHQTALTAITLADGHTSNPQIRQLAATMTTDMRADIAALTEWLRTRGMPAPANHADMPGMDHSTLLSQLTKATGPAFDSIWLTESLDHYGQAVAMADDELREGYEPGVKAIAQKLATDGRAIIAKLRALSGQS